MLRLIILLLAIVLGLGILIQLIMGVEGVTQINLTAWSFEVKTPLFLLALLVIPVLGYIVIAFLRYLLTLHRRIGRFHGKRLAGKAGKELVQGLVYLTEGHWAKAEKQLLKHLDYCETPVVNYLAAARAAHMQENFEKRDELLKQAVDRDKHVDVAVSVAQAEMQLDSEQTAQAQATLLRLQEMSPNHPYISKLLAKVYLRQKNWEALFELLPSLLKQKVVKSKDILNYKAAALGGLFEQYSKAGRLDDLQKAWRKLPQDVRDNPQAVGIFVNALQNMGEVDLSAKTLVAAIDKHWDDALVELYGSLQHKDPIAAGEVGKRWLAQKSNNPAIMLTMARLNTQKKLWGKAKTFYETRLNQLPDSKAYFELAQLLESMGEQGNADTCYRVGLKYCISKEVERLNLKSSSDTSRTPLNAMDEDHIVV